MAQPLPSIFEDLVALSSQAGSAILDIYHSRNSSVQFKADSSPVTTADFVAHKILQENLPRIKNLPVLSEEGNIVDWAVRKNWNEYWLVDPLDGTREFIKRNGEFTVNIALIRAHQPVLGIVYAPLFDLYYWGGKDFGSFRKIGVDGVCESISCAPLPSIGGEWNVLDSRSRFSAEAEEWLSTLGRINVTRMGSSLKLCKVADGSANLYLRMGPTSEWDTAAAQAVLEGAGGKVVVWPTNIPIFYNRKQSLLNPSFLVSSQDFFFSISDL